MPTGIYPRKETLARFKSFIKVENGHWLWIGGVSNGYGAFWSNNQWIGAHVFSYTAFVGSIPAGRQIRHKCDTRQCVNPKHLETGTALDNAADRERHHRHKHLATTSKLSDEQVIELRAKYGSRRPFDSPSLDKIGQEYGISAPSVCWLLKGHTYRKVVMPT